MCDRNSYKFFEENSKNPLTNYIIYGIIKLYQEREEMIKMNFWLIVLLVNMVVAVLVLIFTYELAFTTARIIKSIPNYPKKKISFGEKLFSFLSTIVKSLIPIYNIMVLFGLLFCDRQEMIERIKEQLYAEMGE